MKMSIMLTAQVHTDSQAGSSIFKAAAAVANAKSTTAKQMRKSAMCVVSLMNIKTMAAMRLEKTQRSETNRYNNNTATMDGTV
mmetsp:Transcript_109072/g.213700  ORF Transcript_109072/g.213700 Transcript_109072/m.213700 type:complete len:83 (-) Transcript_109072:93-341(-)